MCLWYSGGKLDAGTPIDQKWTQPKALGGQIGGNSPKDVPTEAISVSWERCVLSAILHLWESASGSVSLDCCSKFGVLSVCLKGIPITFHWKQDMKPCRPDCALNKPGQSGQTFWPGHHDTAHEMQCAVHYSDNGWPKESGINEKTYLLCIAMDIITGKCYSDFLSIFYIHWWIFT